MAVRGRPGEDRSFTMKRLTRPDGTPITTGTVEVAILDRYGAVATGPFPAAASATNPSDWTAAITFPATRGPYRLVATHVPDGGGEAVEVATNPVIVWETPPAGWVTRRQLRRDIAERLGDFVQLTATRDGSNVTFYDEVGLSVPMNAYRGRQAVVVAGHTDNVGEVRRVAANSPSGTMLTFTPSLPQPTRTGDVIELYDERSIGYRVEQINAAINRAIRAAGLDALVFANADLTPTPAGDRAIIVRVPQEWEYLTAVRIPAGTAFHQAGGWMAVPPARGAQWPGWWVERDLDGSWQVRITAGPGWVWPETGSSNVRSFIPAPPATVRLEGLTLPDELETDDDATPVDYEWLVQRAMSELRLARAHRHSDRAGEERMGLIYEQNAERARQTVRRLLPRNARRLR